MSTNDDTQKLGHVAAHDVTLELTPAVLHKKPTTKRPDKKSSKQGGVVSTIIVIAMALAMAFLLVTYVFHSYQVDGASMETTLQNGDRLIVWKLPRTVARITGHPYIPNRGDIVIFNESGLSSYGQSQDTKQLIKRVIGLPGDRVVVHGGEVTVYNKEHPGGFDPDKTLAYGKVIKTTENDTDVSIHDGQVFVMGDNRAQSLDSRYFGPIDANNIIGKLVLRIMPFSQITKF